jgi:hypothetical protein
MEDFFGRFADACRRLRGFTPLFVRFERAGHSVTATVLLHGGNGLHDDADITRMVQELQETLDNHYRGTAQVEPIYMLSPVSGKYETHVRITSPDDSPTSLKRLLNTLAKPMYRNGLATNMQVTRDADGIVTKLVLTSTRDSLKLRNAFEPFADFPVEHFKVDIAEPTPEDVTTVTIELSSREKMNAELAFVHYSLCSWLTVYVDVRTVTDTDTVVVN